MGHGNAVHMFAQKDQGPEAMGASSTAGPQKLHLSKAFQALNEILHQGLRNTLFYFETGSGAAQDDLDSTR